VRSPERAAQLDMAAKDYVYLALIAFSAIVFYLHGWLAGTRTRPVREESPVEPVTAPELSLFVTTVDAITTERGRVPGSTHSRTRLTETPVHCFFGNN